MQFEGGNIYQWLLQDPRWQKLRYWVLKRAGGRCEKCHRPCSHLQIHHWFYGTGYNGKVRKPWDYRPRQLVAVCRKCHVRLHRKDAHKLKGGSSEACETHCGGILSSLRKWLPDAIKSRFQSHFSVRYDLQPNARWTLSQNGNMTIEAIQVCREPVQAMIAKALNAMSFGRFNRQMAANGYDKMFHLFMSIKLVGGPTIRMERNEVISIKQSDTKGAEQMNVPLNGAPITLNTLWQKALQTVGYRIYEYDPIQNNCQKFVNDVLQANQLLTPALQTFIVQRADNLLPMYAQKFGRWTTDLAAKFNHVLFGHGRMGGVWPPGPTAPPPPISIPQVFDDPTWHGQVSASQEWNRHDSASGTTAPGPSDHPEDDYDQWPVIADALPEPGPPSTTVPPPEQKGSGRFRRKGGKYAHSSSSQSRAQQDKQVAEDQAKLTESVQQNLQAVKDFIDAYKNNDEKAAMAIVMELTSKATGNPATAGLIPLLTGTADLITRHTNPLDPNYHKKIRQYLDAAFSVIPVVGPVLENWIAPMQEDKFNAPADSYTGQIIADPSKARKFDGNLWMQDWSHADPTGYWKIKTADQMREYNKKYGTNYTVYGGA